MTHLKNMIPHLLLSVGLVFMVSCTDSASNTTDPDPTPKPPSAKTMAIDLSIFASDQYDPNSGGDYDNYEAAATAIKTVQAVMSRNVNLSLDAFQQADTAEAEMLNDTKTKWQWTFSNEGDEEQEGALIYDFRLVAEQQSDDELMWDLFLSSPALSGEENRYLSGTTNPEVTEGVWTYYSIGRIGIAQPQQQEMAELDWEIDESENVDMQFELLGGKSAVASSQMDYRTNGPARTIELTSSKDGDGETTIEFNADTKAGFIIAPNYNNGEKACWNGDFEDVDCTED